MMLLAKVGTVLSLNPHKVSSLRGILLKSRSIKNQHPCQAKWLLCQLKPLLQTWETRRARSPVLSRPPPEILRKTVEMPEVLSWQDQPVLRNYQRNLRTLIWLGFIATVRTFDKDIVGLLNFAGSIIGLWTFDRNRVHVSKFSLLFRFFVHFLSSFRISASFLENGGM